MKKIIAILMAVMVIASMTVTAHAVTPKLKTPSIKIPEIKSVKVELSDSFWDNWFAEHPIVFKVG